MNTNSMIFTTDEDRGRITLFTGKPMETTLDLNSTDLIPDGNGLITHSGLDAAIKVVFNHPNVGPFISRHLIKHFVTSNPTPGYIEEWQQSLMMTEMERGEP